MADELDEVVGDDAVEDDEDTEADGEPITPDGTDDNVDPTAAPNGEEPDGM